MGGNRKFIYCTADKVGAIGGGGVVTSNESAALASVGEVCIVDGAVIGSSDDPFELDARAHDYVQKILEHESIRLAHFYAGGFPRTVMALKAAGIRVTYTAAAHNISESRAEYDKLGIPYSYKHITNPELWSKYLSGYLAADSIICPSEYSAEIMRKFGCKQVCVIQHGTDIPSNMTPFPKRFSAGYLGRIGPDKGITYLLSAWKFANIKNGILIMAGADSPAILPWARRFGGGNIELRGFAESLSGFFSDCSIYVQPSVTEGYGIEVIEAMAHGRPVIVSDGAGASNAVTDGRNGFVFRRRDVKALAELILRCASMDLLPMGLEARDSAVQMSWTNIREKYAAFWRTAI